MTTDFDGDQMYDFVIIGSGAGGGPACCKFGFGRI